MVRLRASKIVVLLVVADIASSNVFNTTIKDIENDLKLVETRRKKKSKHSRSTSSSSGEIKGGSSDVSGESLDLSSSASSSSSEHTKKDYRPKSSKERKGWRKWHRKCTPCPIEMRKKWRDPSINWICGAYQRARRSFKSDCMMRYRNCQDGTMFVKIHSNRCANDTGREPPHGEHFFYEYKVMLTDESSDSKADSDTSSASSDHDWRRAMSPATKLARLQ